VRELAPPFAALLPLIVESTVKPKPVASTAMPPPLPDSTRLPVTVVCRISIVPAACTPPPRESATLSRTKLL
jgi:hypothetical protein